MPTCDGAKEKSGDCCYLPPGGGGPKPGAPVSAGDIQLADATTKTILGGLGFDPMLGYTTFQWSSPDWSLGDTISATAKGATTSMFVVTAKAPAPIAGITPAWDDKNALSIDRAKGFHVSWTPDGVAARMTLLLQAETPPKFDDRGTVVCTAPDAQGKLDVDASLFQHFHAGDVCSICGLARDAFGTVKAGDTDASLVLTMNGGGTATFQ